MLTLIEYIKEEDGMMICRCYGTGSHLQLPERVAGEPVTALADHCFAAEASFSLRHVKKQTAVLSEKDGRWIGRDRGTDIAGEGMQPAGLPALCADRLESIILPASLLRIGNYAFYGCHKLKEIHFPAALVSLGGGAFVASYHLERFCFERNEGQLNPPCMKDVLGDYRYEIEAVVTEGGREQYRLYFPEYYEEAVENTPGREIQMEFHGTGYRYRQCFMERQINFARYDSWFYTTTVQEPLQTAVKLALYRIQTPVGLGRDAKEAYLDFLRKEYRQLARYIFREEQTGLIRLLDQEGYFTEEIADSFVSLAGETSHAEAVSALLEIRRKLRPVRKRKYEL